MESSAHRRQHNQQSCPLQLSINFHWHPLRYAPQLYGGAGLPLLTPSCLRAPRTNVFRSPFCFTARNTSGPSVHGHYTAQLGFTFLNLCGRKGVAAGRGEPAAVWLPRSQAASASKAIRLRITKVEPSSLMSSFFRSSLNSRVTVSRDEPIICAISSCVRLERILISRDPFSRPTVHESNNRANLPAEERARTNSWISRYAD